MKINHSTPSVVLATAAFGPRPAIGEMMIAQMAAGISAATYVRPVQRCNRGWVWRNQGQT